MIFIKTDIDAYDRKYCEIGIVSMNHTYIKCIWRHAIRFYFRDAGRMTGDALIFLCTQSSEKMQDPDLIDLMIGKVCRIADL